MQRKQTPTFNPIESQGRFCLEIRPYGNFCPHSCEFCYQEKKEENTPIDVNIAMKALESTISYMSLNSMKELKLVFHGGEPAYNGGNLIFEIAKNAQKLFEKTSPEIKVHYLCHTSGFSELDIDGFVKRNIFTCVNRQVPNRLSIEKQKVFKRNIELLFDNNLLIKQIIVLTDETMKHVDMCLDAISEFGLPTKLQPQFPSRSGFSLNRHYPADKDISNFITSLKVRAKSRGISLCRTEPVNHFEYNSETTSFSGCRFSDECTFSEGPIRSMAVDADGLIYACNRFAGVKALPLAKVEKYEQSIFDDLESSKKRIKFIYGFRALNMKKKCNSCLLGNRKICSATGGCPFFAYIWQNGYEDPYCSLDKMLYLSFGNYN